MNRGCNDEERFQIASKIDLLEEKSNEIDNKIQDLNKDIYRLANYAYGWIILPNKSVI